MTARVTIGPPRAEDEDEWIERVKASRRLHGRWVEMADTPNGYRSYLARQLGDDRRASYTIRRSEDNAIVGWANISEFIRGVLQQCFLGYGAFAPFEGRGYMSEGLALVVREAFTTHSLHRIEANIQPANEPSKALARRVGFAKEGYSPSYLKIAGVWCDHERWAITLEQWQAQQRA